MRLDSGCAPHFARCLSPCSLDKLSVFPLSFVTVPSFSRSYNTDDPPSLLHWTICLSFLQQILAHQNFSRNCTTFLLRHFHVSTGRLRLFRQSSRGRKRLHALNLELIHHYPFLECNQVLARSQDSARRRSQHVHCRLRFRTLLLKRAAFTCPPKPVN